MKTKFLTTIPADTQWTVVRYGVSLAGDEKSDGRMTGRHSPYEAPLRNDYWETHWNRNAFWKNAR